MAILTKSRARKPLANDRLALGASDTFGVAYSFTLSTFADRETDAGREIVYYLRLTEAEACRTLEFVASTLYGGNRHDDASIAAALRAYADKIDARLKSSNQST